MVNSLRSTVRELRKQAVVETFFETMKNFKQKNPFATQEEIIGEAVKNKAPRFYVTFENARRFVSLLARKKRLPLVNKNKIEMYKELYRRYMKHIQENLENCSTKHYTILEHIIEEPAPSFYLDEETFRCILYKTLRKRNTIFCHS